jgi:hypothetical protein
MQSRPIRATRLMQKERPSRLVTALPDRESGETQRLIHQVGQHFLRCPTDGQLHDTRRSDHPGTMTCCTCSQDRDALFSKYPKEPS